MRFAITGRDERFPIVRELLLADGHTETAPGEAEVLIPPPWERGARYARSECYQIANAALTAEGALELLRARCCVSGSRALVVGFGRVGKLCAVSLAGAGALVTVAARSGEQRAWARALELETLDTAALAGQLGDFDLVVNTVPAPMLTEELLRQLREETVLLELASAPGGIDAAAAREQGKTYLRAPGLPARYDPERAAAILRDAVYETREKPRLGVALTGSHCTLNAVLEALVPLRYEYDLVPILSRAAGETDTYFGPAAEFRARLETLCGKKTITAIPEAEPLGAREALAALLVAPCTGNTLARLAHGITDTPVTMACKAHLRNGRPLILSPSTNDGLSGSAENIGRLLQRKNVYFVPFAQDAPEKKPFSLQSDLALLEETVRAALRGEQLQPVLR